MPGCARLAVCDLGGVQLHLTFPWHYPGLTSPWLCCLPCGAQTWPRAASPHSLCLLSHGEGGDKSLQPQARCHDRGEVPLVPAKLGAHSCSSCAALQEPWSWDGASPVRLGEALPSCLGTHAGDKDPPAPPSPNPRAQGSAPHILLPQPPHKTKRLLYLNNQRCHFFFP